MSNNTTSSLGTGIELQILSAKEIVFISLYSVVVTVGIIGNSLVMAIIKTSRSLHTTTNFLLGNLALADTLILLWVFNSELLSLTYDHPSGITGDYLCKVFTGGFPVSFLIRVGLLTLTALAYERYNGLVNAMNSRGQITKENFCRVVSAMWVSSFLVGIPEAAASKYDQNIGYCIGIWFFLPTNRVHWGYRVYATALLAFFNIVPGLIISFCYYKIIKGLAWDMTICGQEIAGQNDINAKKKIVNLLVTVTALFYVCYLPFTIVIMLSAWQQDTLSGSFLLKLKIGSSFLVFCSSCFNPILYSCQSTNYRIEMKNLLRRLFKLPCKNCKICIRVGTNVSGTYELRGRNHETVTQHRARYNSRKSTTQEGSI